MRRSPRAYAADPLGLVPHDVTGSSGRGELGVGGHVDPREPVEQAPGLATGLDGGPCAQLPVAAHVAADQLIAVGADPDHTHRGAAIGIDRGEVD